MHLKKMTSTITIFFFCLLSVHMSLFQNVLGQCLRDIPPAALGCGLSNPRPCLGAGLASSGLGIGLVSSGINGLGGLAASEAGLGAGLQASDLAYDISSGTYGGSGVGNLNVFGELPVSGSTLMSGQVPILGSVRFAGPLPATGSVSICGSCNCGCSNGY